MTEIYKWNIVVLKLICSQKRLCKFIISQSEAHCACVPRFYSASNVCQHKCAHMSDSDSGSYAHMHMSRSGMVEKNLVNASVIAFYLLNPLWTSFLKSSKVMAGGRKWHLQYTFACRLTVSVLLLVNVLLTFTLSQSSQSHNVCFFTAHIFMAICYCSSIYYRLIGWCVLWPVLFVLQISSNLKRRLACDLVLSFSFDIVYVYEYGFSLMSDIHKSRSASLEQRVHWVWEIISDWLEKTHRLS